MFCFHSIAELINTLNRSKDLLSEMFEKRKSFAYKYDHAVEVVDEDFLETLIELEVIRKEGSLLEIDDPFLQFFEQILEVNEEINTATVHENIRTLKQHINYYLQEGHGERKHGYLKVIKAILRKIGLMTLRNIVDLNRNIDNTFKTEPTYKIKIGKLENYDQKRQDINALIRQTQKLLDGEELTFLSIAPDEEFVRIVTHLRIQLNEAHHNLIETQKQIIDFLNQVKYQSQILEKIRQIKYLKDQFELKDRTNFLEVLAESRDLFFAPYRPGRMKLSLDSIQEDHIYSSLVKISHKQKTGITSIQPVAGNILAEYLQSETEYEVYIDTQEIKSGFSASSDHLFHFLLHYQYPKEVALDDIVTLYCQLISLYEEELLVEDSYGEYAGIEYAMVYPK